MSHSVGMEPLTASAFAAEIRRRGARRIRRATFRNNRNTIWSLTQRGSVLNAHEAFRTAPPEILDAFAVIARTGGLTTREAREAGRVVHEWPTLLVAIEAARASHVNQRRLAATDAEAAATHCCGTPAQRQYLRIIYAYFNRTRFGGILPDDLPLRLSSRMRSALGHMLPGGDGVESRVVVEIALNVDLMLAGNGPERVDTLLHEMAHAADYLLTGHRGHGRSWKEWARRVGCSPTLCYERPVRRRRGRRTAVDRVPPLPPALVRGADPG